MFFTIIGITLVGILILSFNLSTHYDRSDTAFVTEMRIYSMNNFIIGVEDDLERGLYITSVRSLISLSEYIAENGTFLDDTGQRFSEAFLNGTVNGTAIIMMNDSTFLNWTERISEQAAKLMIAANFTVNDIAIFHEDPWAVTVALNITMLTEDMKQTASWERTTLVRTNISILEFEDPLYVVNTQGRVANKIIVTNITNFVVNNDTTNLQLHVNHSYYLASEQAPSFLMRLEDNLSSSPYGIESLVNLDTLTLQGIPTKTRSVVDYIYFGDQSVTDHEILFMPEWFRLDDEHLEVYECEDLT